jgi:septal ring factor EnvC (AmiA/AmiB activator)
LKNQQERAELDLQKLNDARTDLHLQISALKNQRDELAGKLTDTLAKAENLEAMYKEAEAKAGQGERYRAEAGILRKELASQIESTKRSGKNPSLLNGLH